MIPNEEKEGLDYLTVKILPALLRGIKLKHYSLFIVKTIFIRLEQNINLNLMKKYVKIKTSVKF